MHRTALTLIVVAATFAAVTSLAASPPGDSATPTPAASGPHRDGRTHARVGHGDAVSVAVYHLGNQAFVDPTVTNLDPPNAPVPQELTAVVHYPTDLGNRQHPLVIMVHGSWWSCVDKVHHKPTGDWPCAAGSVPLQSYRGYDYLGNALARRGDVVVSISANAINAHVLGDPDYYGRAHLLNKHLEMWQQLATTGAGPLRGQFRDPHTGRHVDPDFAGHVDMQDVGTLGHSRGGRAVMWQASDKHSDEWPAGIRVRGVVALAPVYFVPPGENKLNTLVSKIPFEVITGSCDGAVGGDYPGRKYLHDVQGTNRGAKWVSIAGGNHDNFNTNWTPGHIGGYDDATSPCPDEVSGRDQRHQTIELVTSFFASTLGHGASSRR